MAAVCAAAPLALRKLRYIRNRPLPLTETAQKLCYRSVSALKPKPKPNFGRSVFKVTACQVHDTM